MSAFDAVDGSSTGTEVPWDVGAVNAPMIRKVGFSNPWR
jgi:hypothetical protein